ncbi:HET-domain-containing protein [Tothia fuscella]|uniref:HET-domain-containing protein n=1 Tax=Tothia fuscella TaxID=1048955 RepID=A0A9P4U0X5_9PEZI|nr:HET-domain-containing protein [Tothia fuscella]
MEGNPAPTIYSHPLSEGSIRLLELEPGNESELLRCNLRSALREDVVDTYEAVSYVWGDESKKKTIQCNGIDHSITESLHSLLKTVRYSTKHRLLWADALSINQADNTEKEHQVKQMGEIYKNAKTVLVYLGPDDQNVARDCFDLITDFNTVLDDKLQECDGNIARVKFEPPNKLKNDTKKWQSVVSLSKLKWFERLWVVQEAGLAKDCTALWGRTETLFANIIEMFLWLICKPDISELFCPQVDLKWADIFLRVQCTLGNTITWRNVLPLCSKFNNFYADQGLESSTYFIDVLRTGRTLKATNPQDFVYGLLGSSLAVMDNGRLIVQPHYRGVDSLKEMCLEVASRLLHDPLQAPFLLGNVDHTSTAHIGTEDGWPSWVPRWHLGKWTTQLSTTDNWYLAGGPKDHFRAQVLPNGILSLQGVIFDRLLWKSASLSQGNFSLDSKHWDEETLESKESPYDRLWKSVLDSCPHTIKAQHQELLPLEDVFRVTLCREYPATLGVKLQGVNTKQLRYDLERYAKQMRKAAKSVGKNTVPSPPASNRVVRFAKKLSESYNRHLAHTGDRRLVLTPSFAEEGDLCVVFPGAPVPFLIRRLTDIGYYHLVGDCYIYGTMRGEVLQLVQEGKYTLQTIILR